jgi:hypothetical protein
MGNSIESMDLGFALQARCLEAVANGSVDAASCVVPVLAASTPRSPPATSIASTRPRKGLNSPGQVRLPFS